MPRIEYAIASAAVRGNGQDRARVFETGDDVVVVLADGAGGTGNGAAAADAVVNAVGAAREATRDWCEVLVAAHSSLNGGEEFFARNAKSTRPVVPSAS